MVWLLCISFIAWYVPIQIQYIDFETSHIGCRLTNELRHHQGMIKHTLYQYEQNDRDIDHYVDHVSHCVELLRQVSGADLRLSTIPVL